MKGTFKNVVIGILMVALMLGTVATAEIDLSGMTAEELAEVISKAGATLETMEPIDNDNILYDKDDITISIDYLELMPEKDKIIVHLVIINKSDLDIDGVYFSYVAINGWEVESFCSGEVKHKTNSRNGYINIGHICELSGISSFDEIESIEAYGTVDTDKYYEMHYIMTITSEEGLKVLKREEVNE